MGIVVLFLIISLTLESSITTLPLTLLILLFASVATRSNNIFGLAFLSGLALDLLSFRTIGISSIYFTCFIFVIFLYQKKFEIQTLHFIIIFSFLGSLGYLILIGANNFFIQSIFSAFLSSSSFFTLGIFNRKKLKYN